MHVSHSRFSFMLPFHVHFFFTLPLLQHYIVLIAGEPHMDFEELMRILCVEYSTCCLLPGSIDIYIGAGVNMLNTGQSCYSRSNRSVVESRF